MRITKCVAVVALCVLLGETQDVLAWGPAIHLGLASRVLDGLTVLPAAVGLILSKHAASYLYGNIAADVVFAKRWSRVKQFCHHWSTALGMLDAADDDGSKAFVYGYLSHLAADTVAHGKYVPRQILVSRSSVGFGHMYWELRADSLERDASWRLLDQVLQSDHDRHHDALQRHITDTFLSYDMNRMLFESISALATRQSFRRSVGVWSRCSRWYLRPELIEQYRDECLDRIQSILTTGGRSSLLREDPNGTSALMHVRVRRREVRRLRRRGIPVEHRLAEMSRALAPKPRRESIVRP